MHSRPDAAPSDSLIRFERVHKSFGSLAAVRDVDLAVRTGEIVTIVGPSGCGKSTLLNMAAGLFQPSSGEVSYRGVPVRTLNTDCGYMTQVDHLLPWRTLAGNVAIPLEIAGLQRREIAARVEALLADLGLGGFAAAYPAQLSGGMRKRAALARLLAYDPETLLMDEPFAALDAQMRLKLQIQLRALCLRLDKTVLFVTHDVDEAIALGDRCVVFTARPGTIEAVIDIDLPRQRDLMVLRSDAAYAAQCAALWRLLAPAVFQSAEVAS